MCFIFDRFFEYRFELLLAIVVVSLNRIVLVLIVLNLLNHLFPYKTALCSLQVFLVHLCPLVPNSQLLHECFLVRGNWLFGVKTAIGSRNV